jgi:hypothetical protein
MHQLLIEIYQFLACRGRLELTHGSLVSGSESAAIDLDAIRAALGIQFGYSLAEGRLAVF